MDTAQWPQDLGVVKPMEENNSTTGRTQNQQQMILERRVRPQKEQALNCPRCNSTNTKFCYYNNYSLTQPRYFCKTCRRYWTEGGSLRSVPVGGGSRRNKRSSSAASASSTTTTVLSSSKLKLSSDQNPKFREGHDLNLAFHLPEFSAHDHFPSMESNCTSAATLSAMELLRSTGGTSNRGPNTPFMPMAEYPSGFGVQHYMRSNALSIPLDSISEQRLLFPFEDPSRQQHEQVMPSADEERFVDQQNRGQGGGNPPGFWNGMLGSGGGSGSW